MSQLPNFFLLGAPKSGTTTLYHGLEKHPAVHLSTPKEPYYFEDEYEQGPEFYWRTYFAAAWTGQPLIGDARTTHLYLPYVPRRIYDTVPDARLVAILRNPVERAFSHWWMQCCYGYEPLGFDQALRENRQAIGNGDSYEGEHAERLWRAHIAPQRDARGLRPVSARPYIEAGHYADHLERYLRYFPRSRLCILFHDDLRRAPLETMRRLYEFLGLDPADLRDAPARENVALTGFSRPLFLVSNRLRFDRVLPRKVLAVLRTTLSQIGSRPKISPQSRDWLREHYEPHNRRLEALVGRDLADWDR